MRPLAWLVEPQAWRERRAAVAARPVGVPERGQVWVLETAQAEAPPAAALGPPSAQAGQAAPVVLRPETAVLVTVQAASSSVVELVPLSEQAGTEAVMISRRSPVPSPQEMKRGLTPDLPTCAVAQTCSRECLPQ